MSLVPGNTYIDLNRFSLARIRKKIPPGERLELYILCIWGKNITVEFSLSLWQIVCMLIRTLIMGFLSLSFILAGSTNCANLCSNLVVESHSESTLTDGSDFEKDFHEEADKEVYYLGINQVFGHQISLVTPYSFSFKSTVLDNELPPPKFLV